MNWKETLKDCDFWFLVFGPLLAAYIGTFHLQTARSKAICFALLVFTIPYGYFSYQHDFVGTITRTGGLPAGSLNATGIGHYPISITFNLSFPSVSSTPLATEIRFEKLVDEWKTDVDGKQVKIVLLEKNQDGFMIQLTNETPHPLQMDFSVSYRLTNDLFRTFGRFLVQGQSYAPVAQRIEH